MSHRNAGVELMRILLTIGIIALHTLCYIGKGLSPAAHLCESCVVGFVFISGYFGITFTIRKLVNFYGIVLFCACWNILCLWLSGCEPSELGGRFLGYLRVWWFANAYVFLMLVSPLVNKALDACQTTKELIACCAAPASIVYLWGFASSVPFLHDYVPIDKSITTNSGLTLMGIYILARVFRKAELGNRLKPCVFAIIGGASAVVCLFNLGKYNSIFAFLFMASLFVFFRRMGDLPQKKYGGQIVLFSAPSMFSVYLIHVGGFVRLPWGSGLSTVHLVGDDPGVIRTIGVVLLVFVVSLCIDLLRRGLVNVIRRFSLSRGSI